MNNITTLLELEQARQELLHAELPANIKASQAEKLGDYRTAKHLWEMVAKSAEKDSLTQKYAQIRHNFCQSAVMHNYKRPELKNLEANHVKA